MVISFSIKEARDHLTSKGYVYTFRWSRRKQFKKLEEQDPIKFKALRPCIRDWANKGRGTRKICDVVIGEVGRFSPGGGDLENYVEWSGFNSWRDWYWVIMELKPSGHGCEGYLYKVQQLATKEENE